MTDQRRLVVLYGSQTGTAQEVAERVAREGKRLHFSTHVLCFDEFPLQNLPGEGLVVYVCSTTGQGEEPDNMKKSWRMLLRKSLPNNSLAAQRFGVLGYGDDQHDLGPDFVIDPWLQTFWDKAIQLYPLPEGLEPISKEALPSPKYKVIWLDDEINQTENKSASNEERKSANNDGNYSVNSPFSAEIKACSRITPESHFQDVRLVEMDIDGSGIKYSPGDIASVMPNNLQDNVDFFFQLFPNLDKNRRFVLESIDPSFPLPPKSILPTPCTILEAVTCYFDIQSIPKRYFFELLAHFTSDEMEKEKFIEFNTAEGQQELYEYCNRPRRNILEIKSRSFSIASSQEKHNNTLQLLVAVVKYRSNLKAPRLGLCSNWLSRQTLGNKVSVWTRKGTMKFPPDAGTPCVLVGPGTGVAPFRSFVSSLTATNSSREVVLFFGCRNKEADFFFADEWSQCSGNVKVITAFSRDQEDKIYVQHKMQENKELICDLIFDKSGWFYVAGNSKFMPSQVREALVESLQLRLNSQEEAESFVAKMETTNRYQTETWS